MKLFIRLPVLFLFLALFFSSSISSAGLAQVKVAGFNAGTGAGSYSYQGSAAANSGSFWTTGSIIVGGKTIDLGASIPLAANMAEFAVGVVRGNPAWAAGLAVTAWLLPYAIEWHDGSYSKHESSAPANATQYGWTVQGYSSCPAGGYGCFMSGEEAADWACTNIYGRAPGSFTVLQKTDTTVSYSCNPGGAYSVRVLKCGGGQIYVVPPGACVVPGETWRPPTEEEWNSIKAQPVPDAVPDQIADNVPVPVQTPKIEPTVVPISQPYLNPQGQPVQDIVQVTPAP